MVKFRVVVRRYAANHWPEAVRYHSANHPDVTHACQDLMSVDWRGLPLHELLLASPACQGHSNAGQPASAGTGGSHPPTAEVALARHQADRNTAWAVLAALDTCRPAVAIVENVVPFQRWPLFPQWLAVVEAMGYHCVVETLNGLSWGSPQDRPRTIITASLAGPLRVPRPLPMGSPSRTILDSPDHPSNRWSLIETKSLRMRSRMRKAQGEAGPVCIWNNVSESRGRTLDEPLPTLTTKSGSQLYLLEEERCRILNPRELARAQGFPDTYRLPPQRELASRLIGNAIDTRLATALVGAATQ